MQPDAMQGSQRVGRHVTVESVRLRFAAAHMATIGGELEPLHGHNYEVRARVDGARSEEHTSELQSH